MFFHILVNCTFKVYFFTVYPAPPPPIFVQFYWSFTSLHLVTLSVLSASLFLLSWGACCCIFVLLVSKDIVPLRVFGQVLRAAHFSSSLHAIARLCPPCFLVWLFEATRLYLKQRSQVICRNS